MKRRLFRMPLRRAGHLADEVDAEIALHLELRTAQLMERGLCRGDAEREARRQFGPMTTTRAALLKAARHRERRLTMLDHLDAIRHDLGYTLRQLRRAPGLAIAVTLTFALGIGANATMFGIIDHLLLRPPAHVANPERVVQVASRMFIGTREFNNTGFSYPGFTDLHENVDAFSGVAMSTYPSPVSLGLGEDARSVRGVLVSGEYFQVMGPRMVAGRPILPDDNTLPTGQAVVVISEGLWEREFGSRPEALGSTLRLAGRPYTIVGVAPAGFVGVQTRPIDAWIPVAAGEGLRFGGDDWDTNRNAQWMSVYGRLAPGATRPQAVQQVTAAIRAGEEIRRGRPDTVTTAILQSVMPSDAEELSAEKKVALVLGAVSIMVLLIACANVANLLLVRAVSRRREIAVRLAVGIARARLVRQLLVESAVLAVAGGLAALLVVNWGSAFVQRVLLANHAWPASAVDTRVLLFTLGATVVVGLVAGLAPALQGSTPDLTRALKDGTRGSGLVRSRLRASLLVIQAALSVILLIGTGLFVRSLERVEGVDPGMDLHALVEGRIDLQSVNFDTLRAREYYARAIEAVRGIPGITHAVVTEASPFTDWSIGTSLRTPDRDSMPPDLDYALTHTVMPGYFATVGTRITRGRDFTEDDTHPGSEPVAIMNERSARAIWPDQDPIGRCVHTNDSPCIRIIGIAADTHLGQLTDVRERVQLYLPWGRRSVRVAAATILARADGDPGAYIEPVRRAMQSAMPDLPFASVRPLYARLDNELRPWRLGAAMFGVFGAIAVVLSALGLYSIIAYSVAQRTHEMGVRVALGASSGSIRRLVLVQGLRLAVIGAAVGVVAALASGRFVQELLYEISPRDPAVYVGVIALMLAIAVVACLLPARRAVRADPLVALRAE